MPRHRNSGSYRPGINPKTGEPAMTAEQLKVRRREKYEQHKTKTIAQNWIRQIGALGWSPDEYRAAHDEQAGLCAICKQPERRQHRTGVTCRLAADHNHKTGRRRGLLCTRCNTGLGLFGDSPELLEAAIIYLMSEENHAEFRSTLEVQVRTAA